MYRATDVFTGALAGVVGVTGVEVAVGVSVVGGSPVVKEEVVVTGRVLDVDGTAPILRYWLGRTN